MKPIVTRKSELKTYLELCLEAYNSDGLPACVKALELHILSRKVKFPLLEFCGRTLYDHVDPEEHIPLCDGIEALKTEGGNVLLGILLQCRLKGHFETSLTKATEYIAQAHIWYICDIIGERVYGYALLHTPVRTHPWLQKLSVHPANWVVRAMGAGIHYAIKKGLPPEHVALTFPILLSRARSKDKEIRQGIGWAAKTTAKFHPELIRKFDYLIQDEDKVSPWFRRKITIGLNRNAYAQGNPS